MKKLRLDLDAIQVETFVAGEEEGPRGTVRGKSSEQNVCGGETAPSAGAYCAVSYPGTVTCLAGCTAGNDCETAGMPVTCVDNGCTLNGEHTCQNGCNYTSGAQNTCQRSCYPFPC